MANVKDFFQADKRIGYFPGWSKPEPETSYIWFDAPLEIEGVAQAGLVLHGGCFANRPEVHVSFELRVSRAPGRHCLPIERIDWRSLEGGHSNPRKPRTDWSGKRVSETHLHDFWLNWSESEGRMRSGGLTVAREIERPLANYLDLISYVGKRLKINNIEVVKEPDWLYDLFAGRI